MIIKSAKPQGPIVIQIQKTKDEALGKYMYSSSILFLMDKERGLAFGVKTDIYTGVLATAITETIRNTAMIFERLHSKIELYDAETKELIATYDLNDDDVAKQLLPLELLKQTNFSAY